MDNTNAQVNDLIGVIDRQGNLIYSSPPFMHLFGARDRADFKSFGFNAFTEEDRKKIISAIETTLAKPGEPIRMSLRLKEPAQLPFHLSFHPILDKEGNLEALRCLGTIPLIDQTTQTTNKNPARLKAEVEWKHIQELTRVSSLIDFPNDPVFALDKDLKVVSWNSGAERVFALTGPQARGKALSELLPSMVVEGTSADQVLLKLKATGTWEGEIAVELKDGARSTLITTINKVTGPQDDTIGYIAIQRDISLLKKARQLIIYSSGLIDQSSDPIFSLDNSFRIMTMNPGAEKLYHISAADAVGHTFTEILSGTEYIDTSWEKVIAAIEKTGYFQGEMSMRLKSGRIIHLSVNINRLKDEQDVLLGYVVIQRDISRLKDEEIKLKYQSQLISSSSDAIYSIDNHFRLVTWNKGSEIMYGISEEEIKGHQFSEFMTITDWFGSSDEEIVQQLKNSGHWKGQLNITNRIGKKIMVIANVDRLKNEKEVAIGYVVLLRDISELEQTKEHLKHSNDRFESLSQATMDMFWDMDIPSDKVKVSGNSIILWGKPRNETIPYSEIMGTVDPLDRSKISESFSHALQDKKVETWNAEFRVIHPDRSIRHVLDRAIILRHPDGEPYRSIGNIQDITERIELYDKIKAQDEDNYQHMTGQIFEAEEKERTRIAADLHDNVNPLLAAAKMQISIAEAHPEYPAPYLLQSKALIYEGIEEIRKISRHLIHNFIGEMSLEEIVESTLLKLIPGTGLQLNTEYLRLEQIDPDPSYKLNLIRIIQEQVLNTIKYAQAKNIYLQISCENGRLKIVQEDDGVGFDIKLHRPGIGLTNMRSRVESYDGTFKFTSTPGKGLRVEIDMPVSMKAPSP